MRRLLQPAVFVAAMVAGVLCWEAVDDRRAAYEHAQYAVIGIGLGLAARQLVRRK